MSTLFSRFMILDLNDSRLCLYAFVSFQVLAVQFSPRLERMIVLFTVRHLCIQATRTIQSASCGHMATIPERSSSNLTSHAKDLTQAKVTVLLMAYLSRGHLPLSLKSYSCICVKKKKGPYQKQELYDHTYFVILFRPFYH